MFPHITYPCLDHRFPLYHQPPILPLVKLLLLLYLYTSHEAHLRGMTGQPCPPSTITSAASSKAPYRNAVCHRCLGERKGVYVRVRVCRGETGVTT